MVKKVMDFKSKFLIFCTLILISSASHSFTKGYNQAWLKNHFGSQWLDSSYDQKYVENLMILNKEGGSKILRVWLYEGSSLRQFIYNEANQTIDLKPELIQNLTHFLLMARKHHVKVNLTFLDANAYRGIAKKPLIKNFWWNVFNNKYGMLDHFYQKAIAPIYNLIASDFKDVVTQIDLVNEVNALIKYEMFEESKKSMSSFLCKLGVRRPVMLTASLGHADASEQFFSGLMSDSCLDFYDIHLYNDTGAISQCADFQRLSKQGYIFQLGEFGQSSESYDDDLQANVTNHFLRNAQTCGFRSALAWRLDDTRSGHNTEARYSYFSFGAPREAYYVMRDFLP
jgi:hypothetical protein